FKAKDGSGANGTSDRGTCSREGATAVTGSVYDLMHRPQRVDAAPAAVALDARSQTNTPASLNASTGSACPCDAAELRCGCRKKAPARFHDCRRPSPRDRPCTCRRLTQAEWL